MFEKNLSCYNCGRSYPPGMLAFRCKKCNGSLEVVFDYARLKRCFSEHVVSERPFSSLRYRELYPVRNPLHAGEGGTPLVRSHNLEKKLGLKFKLWFKLECQNPTGSFKDRGSSIEMAKALEFMVSGEQKKLAAVCASTGNMGASVAAYSGIANVRCSIFTPRDAAPAKLEQILAHGARVYKIRGDYARAAELVELAHKEYGLYLLGDYLYRREGTKSVGFEIMEQLHGIDYIFSPIGNGTLISAVWKALKEFKTLGFTRNLPKLAGIQSSGCNPVVRAFKNKTEVRPVKKARTLAVAIECGNPLDGKRALDSVKESKGLLEDVTDKQILRARELLAEHEGIFAEPAGAASLAGLIRSKDAVPGGGDAVCIITGHGLKVPYTGVRGKPIEIGSSQKMLREIF